MIDLNYIYWSVLFCLICKIISCFKYLGDTSMTYHKRKILSSIPERNESEEEVSDTNWIPKKKHEVLKAKYKCLKKLFQIYDASVIGILPESHAHGDGLSVEERDGKVKKTRRKKRSHRTRTDACAGTNDIASDSAELDEAEQEETIAASAVIRDLKIECSDTCSKTSTAQSDDGKSKTTIDKSKIKSGVTSLTNECSVRACRCQTRDVLLQHPTPHCMCERRKMTRFQSFIHRLLGIRRERPKTGFVLNGHVLAASDNDINQRYVERRRRRGLRFRRTRRPKKVQSEGAIRDSTPALLSYAQAVQRNCLLDTTMRQCPIAGCRMVFYGIINYNDHLNLCHFTERRFVCHFCHEGFENESDKLQHENEHIGLSRLSPFHSAPACRRSRPAITSDTQTDPELTRELPEEKLKKIVSFFDKIADSDQLLADIKKKRYSESNLQIRKTGSEDCQCGVESATATASVVNSGSVTMCSDSGSKRMSSCVELSRHDDSSTRLSVQSAVKCHYCGETFHFRRQLSLHVDLEHRVYDKYSKFHSCAGITNPRTKPGLVTVSTTETSLQETPSTLTQSSASCDPSTNIVCSTETLGKRSMLNGLVDKLKVVNSYKWEPGTKIIRV